MKSSSDIPPSPLEDNDVDEERLIGTFEHDADSLWHENRLLAILTLVGPIVATLVGVAAFAVAQGFDAARRLVLTALLTFFVLGRFVILGGRDAGTDVAGFTPEQLALLVYFMDVMTAIIISWHAGVLFRLPWLGERLRFLMHSGHEVLADNRWMRRTTFLAMVAFVMFPFASSGSVGGSLFGRLLGLSRLSAFLGVLIGSLLGCGTMYFGATIINRYVEQDNMLLRWGGAAAIIILLMVLNRRYRRGSADGLPEAAQSPWSPDEGR